MIGRASVSSTARVPARPPALPGDRLHGAGGPNGEKLYYHPSTAERVGGP